MKNKLWAAGFVFLLGWASLVQAGSEVIQVTDSSFPEHYPSISGNRVVYSKGYDLYMHQWQEDITQGAEIRITHANFYQWRPKIDGRMIVWEDMTQIETQGVNVSACFYQPQDESCPVTLIAGTSDDEYDADVSGNRIVWNRNSNGKSSVWYCRYDETYQNCEPEQLSAEEADARYPHVDGRYVVWVEVDPPHTGERKVILYDFVRRAQYELSSQNVSTAYAHISGRRVVWLSGNDAAGNRPEVSFCDFDPVTGSCPVQSIPIGESGANVPQEGFPVVNVDFIAWILARIPDNGSTPVYSVRVYHVPDQSVYEVAANSLDKHQLDVSYNGIVWMEGENGGYDIFFTPLPSQGLSLGNAASRRRHGDKNFGLELSLDFDQATIEPRQSLLFQMRAHFLGGPIRNPESVVVSGGVLESPPVILDDQTLELTVKDVDHGCLKLDFSGVGVQGDSDVHVRLAPGDIDQSGTIDISDLNAVKRQLFQPVTAKNYLSDVNADGAINIVDLSMIKSHLYQLAETCSE